jgi:predicted nucleotidyltransferase
MKILDKKIKEKIINVIHALIPHVDIYLFGSRATGQHHARSDKDIALDGGKQLDRLDVGEIRDMLNASNMPYNFDIVDFHNIGNDLKKEIENEGILWAKKK